MREILKHYRDRFPGEGYSVCEEYAEARIEVFADFNVSVGGDSADFSAIFRSKNLETSPQAIAANPDVWNATDGRVGYGDDEAVFVQNVEVVERVKLLVASTVRVRPNLSPDEVNGTRVNLCEMPIGQGVLKVGKRTSERELHLAFNRSVWLDEEHSNVIEGGAQVVSRVANDKWKLLRQLERLIGDTQKPFGISVLLDSDGATASIEEAQNDFVKLRSMTFGPVYLEMGP